MKILLTLIAASLLFWACNSNNSQSTSEEISTTDSAARNSTASDSSALQPDSLLSGCYSMFNNRDTASLQVQVKGNQARGSLSYNLYQKDRNDGTFEGELNNGIITGWYLFRSEGVMSVRQVAWKVGNNALWPANGEVIVRNDSTMFRDLNKLRFDSSRAFVKVRCVI